VTVRFCDRYVEKRSRTHDQMVQAARSGVQNIAEGSKASGTSKKMELKLTNVARASLEELKLDYEDYLHCDDMFVHEPVRENSAAAVMTRLLQKSRKHQGYTCTRGAGAGLPHHVPDLSRLRVLSHGNSAAR